MLTIGQGCERVPPSSVVELQAHAQTAGSRFDQTAAATLVGWVTWQGPLPRQQPFEVIPIIPGTGAVREPTVQDNPNFPKIHPEHGGVGEALVFLRGVDPALGRPWDHPPVKVVQRNRGFLVSQGQHQGQIGMVRRGDQVELVSEEAVLHGVRGRGAAFFSLMFPEPRQPLHRQLTGKGLVELSSAVGYFWMRAYLLVDDHPYYTLTDAAGRFCLEQVPPGEYEVVAWLPNWRVVGREHDPESAQISRLRFAAPVQQPRSVLVRPGETQQIDFVFSKRAFLP